jgi:hypothetical protein
MSWKSATYGPTALGSTRAAAKRKSSRSFEGKPRL